MISIVEGRPGTGKTVFLTCKIMSYLNRGFNVYTNIALNLKPPDPRFLLYHYIESLDEVVGKTNAKIVLDEIQVYLNSRSWESLDVKFQLYLQQHRKDGLDIIGATQSVKRADTVFRECVQYFYTLSKLFTVGLGGNVFGLFVVREYDPDAIDVPKDQRHMHRYGWPTLISASPDIFKVFDTMQKVNFDNGVGRYEVITRKIIEQPKISYKIINKEIIENYEKAN